MVAYVSAQSGNHQNGAASSTTVAFTPASAISPGSAVCIAVGWASTVADTITVADNASGNTYTQTNILTGTQGDFRFALFEGLNIQNSPTTITATINTARTFATILVDTFTGVKATAALDGNNINAQPNGTASTDHVTSGNFTPATAGDLIWGASVDVDGGGTIVQGTGFTSAQSIANAYRTEYKLSGVSGTQACTFTNSNSALDRFVTGGLALLPAGGTVFCDAGGGCELSLKVRSANERQRTVWWS